MAGENIVEGYYTAHLWRGIYVAPGLQHINNPGYNRDRAGSRSFISASSTNVSRADRISEWIEKRGMRSTVREFEDRGSQLVMTDASLVPESVVYSSPCADFSRRRCLFSRTAGK